MRDLTQRIQTGMPTFPGDPVVETWPSATLHDDGYQVTAFGLSTHSGTHVDAPAHTEPDGKTLDQYPISRFSLNARLVRCEDVGPNAALDADRLPEPLRDTDADTDTDTDTATDGGNAGGLGGASDVGDGGIDVASDGDAVGDDVGELDVLVFRTGWSDHWGTDRYFEYPHLTPELAAACADRGLDVAIDVPSIDPMHGDLLAHHELLRRDRIVIENLTNLDDLPARFVLHAFPLALEDADGSPVRAVAADH